MGFIPCRKIITANGLFEIIAGERSTGKKASLDAEAALAGEQGRRKREEARRDWKDFHYAYNTTAVV